MAKEGIGKATGNGRAKAPASGAAPAKERRSNIRIVAISSSDALAKVEKAFRRADVSSELMPWAMNTSYVEIAENVIKDREAPWKNKLYLSKTMHRTTIGIQNICRKASEYLEREKKRKRIDVDVLSICACMEDSRIALKVLVRAYGGYNFAGFFNYVGDNIYEEVDGDDGGTSGKLIVPDEVKNFRYTDEEIREHDRLFNLQEKVLAACTPEHPFLNSIESYVPHQMPTPADRMDLVYDLRTSDQKLRTIAPYEQFTRIFQEVMTYVNGVEYYHYVNVMRGEETEDSFMSFLEQYIRDTYVKAGRFAQEDMPAMLQKLRRSLFQLYVVQDLIDDPNVTDVKITAPDAIRARVKGKAYMSNINFIDDKDYIRFVNGIAIRNRISQNVPSQTFTDRHDENYILRFSITAAYVNSVPWPYLHIRKIDRKKLLGDDLVRVGMMDEKLRAYLCDCGKTSRGVVFAGRPGCVDADTEFFNGKGWVKISEWDNEPVLQYDTATGEATLVAPEAYIKEPCSELFHFEADGIDQSLSEEHRVLYKDGGGAGPFREMSGEDLEREVLEGSFHGSFGTSFSYGGRGMPLSDDGIRLMAAIICLGGKYEGDGSDRTCHLALEGARKLSAIEACLDGCGLGYATEDGKGKEFIYTFAAPMRETDFGPMWYSCTAAQSKVLCSAILEWGNGRMGEGAAYRTRDKGSADIVQFAFAASGYRSSILEEDGVYLVFAEEGGMARTPEDGMAKAGRVPTADGFKYCFTVPTHALVLRRNGEIFITGNSGKTVALNWFLEEAYEQSAEILVIQENDELFCYRKGVMFQHVVNYANDDEMPVNLEQLGQLALVAGANVFVIGEAKGPEICSAITLSNSGCRTAITIHSPSSVETLDKMADLAMRGYATDYTQAMRMLKSFQTIVYLEDFKVKEISEITGFNEQTKQMEYRYIYRRELDA